MADANDNGCGKNRQDPHKGASLVPILVEAMDNGFCCCSRSDVLLCGHETQYRREDWTKEEEYPDSNAHVSLDQHR